MDNRLIELAPDNLDQEHVCCAIADKKHQGGVSSKKQWLRERIPEGHVFRKLDAKGKVFIEYAPLESAWVPVNGKGFLYIYCLWVAGSFKGKGYGKALLQSCIEDARARGKSGICVLSSKKKKPFLSDKKFFCQHGFEVVDTAGEDYELLALSFDGTKPYFSDSVRQMAVDTKGLTIYHGLQCPYIPNCIEQVRTFCKNNSIELHIIAIDSLEKAKNVPCVFNNWAVFYQGTFQTVHLLNETYLKKWLDSQK